MRKLRISKEISLPLDAVTQTIAAIGRKGAGKTYLASMLAEQMLDAQAQVIVIDPVGNWWGLRVDADGKSKGKEIFVIGGDHGDIPLVPEAGARIARLLAEKNVSAILDVSGFRIGEHKRFAADFAEEFFHLKKTHRTPVHIFIEEAQKLIPQRVGPDEARMVGAFEQIVRLGRNYGIGATLITQRPQSVNKEVLSQVECLCVLQVTGPHERKALEEWVQEAGADRKLVGELPGLSRGEGYVWSPAWLRIYARVHFSKKTTFDASATPEVGKATRAASISAVDVAALREDMAEVVAQAEKDDPVVLRRKIAQLEKAKSHTTDPSPMALQVTIDRQVRQETARITATRDREWGVAMSGANKEILRLHKLVGQAVKNLGGSFTESTAAVFHPISLEAVVKGTSPQEYISELKKSGTPFEEIVRGEYQGIHSGLTSPEQRILDAIAWMNSIGVREPEQPAVAFLAGYSYGGGAYNNPRGSLKTKGLIEYRGKSLVLTPQGTQAANMPDTDPSVEELHQKVLSVLGGPEKRLLVPLLEAYPGAISNETLANRSNYALGSGSFNNPKGRLRTLGLIEYVPEGVRARDILFP